MNNCERLMARRKELGITQTGLAKMLNMSVKTINCLENDETRWRAMHTKTVDKINSFMDGTFENEEQEQPIKPINDVAVESKHEQTFVVIHESKKDDVLTKDDKKALTLIEFTYEGLVESKTHDDFMANMNMLKRILKKY